MRFNNLIISVCFFLIITSKVMGQYYVSTNGSDLNPGTLSQPFKTIQKAANVMNAGDVCFIMSGIYRETVVPKNSGTSTKHIVFKNYQNDTVRIIGTDKISAWNYYKKGIFKAFAPDTVLQLSVDNTLASEAMYPNFKGNHLSTQNWKKVSIIPSGKAIFEDMNFPQGYWNGGYCFALVGYKWISENGVIDSSHNNVVYCKKRSSPWSTSTGPAYFGEGLGYITHHLNALDTINEWHWQNDTLYFYPKDSAAIDQIHVEARTRIYGFNCTGKNYIEIENLNFIYSTVNFESSTGCILNRSNIIYPTPYFYFEQGWGRDPYQENNNTIAHWRGKGVSLSGEGNFIKNCYIAHSWGDGISIGGKNNTVDSCLITDCDWSATDAAPIATLGSGHSIKHSKIFNSARNIIDIRSTSSSSILYNDLYDCGFINNDLGIIYSFHTNGDSTVIAYNWIHDNHSSGPGVYLDNNDTGYIVHHNVIWNCYDGILTNYAAVNHQIYNNTVWNCTNAIRGSGLINQIVKNNLSEKEWDIFSIRSNNLTIDDPLFVNSSSNNFTLKTNSPAIDYGCTINGITDDFYGKLPDAGAYEYGISPWTPGSKIKVQELSLISNTQHTGINNSDNSFSNQWINIYPNPASNNIHIESSNDEKLTIQLFDITGKEVSEMITFSISTNMNLQVVKPGFYFLQIINENGAIIKSQKIVVAK